MLDRSYQVTDIQYEYDPLYRLTSAIYSGDLSASYSYTYDAVGNMATYVETVGTATSSVNRTFNDANQLVTSSDTELGTASFYYDDNGNMTMIIKPGDPQERLYYHYNQRNLLVLTEAQQGTGPTLPVAEFVYDGDANRLQQIDHTGSQPTTTTYTNDILGLSQVLVSDDGTIQTLNLFGLDLISQDDGTETRFMLVDGLGSVRVEMVDDAIETTTTYEPYGKLLSQTGTTGTTYGFTGEQYDALTSLVYLRARYYNPSLKLFMSRDPFPGYATLSISQNGYAYVHANPVNLTDPSGKIVPFILIGAGFGGIASFTTQAVHNYQNGMSGWDAVYYKNINWANVAGSAVAGGISGGLGAAVLPLVPVGAAALFGEGTFLVGATSIASALGLGGGINSFADFVGRGVETALGSTRCDIFDMNSYRGSFFWGAATAGTVTFVDELARPAASRLLVEARKGYTVQYRDEAAIELWDVMLEVGEKTYPPLHPKAYPLWEDWFFGPTPEELLLVHSPMAQTIRSLSQGTSIFFNADLSKSTWEIFDESND